MNKKVMIWLGLVLVLGLYTFLKWPEAVHIEKKVIIYQLGSENKDTSYESNLILSGMIEKNMLLKETFKGVISIDNFHGIDIRYYDSLDEGVLVEGEFQIDMSRDHKYMTCVEIENGEIDMFTLGEIGFDSAKENVTIGLHTRNNEGGGWNSEDGWMLTSMSNRSDAILFSEDVWGYNLQD